MPKLTIKELLEKWPKAYAVTFEDGWTATAVKYNDVAALARSHEALLAYAQAEERITQHFLNCEDCDPREGDDSRCQEYWQLLKECDPYKLRQAALAEAEKVSQ